MSPAGLTFWVKRLAAFCLLIAFVAPVAGTYAVLQWQKKQIRKEVKWRMIEGIDREELVLLGFATKDLPALLNWKHAAEFEYLGEMYDIVETYTVGDSTYFRVWWDHEETLLNRKLQHLMAEIAAGDQGQRESEERLLQFFKNLYHIRFVSMEVTCRVATSLGLSAPQVIVTQEAARPAVPPPERC